MDWQGSPQAYLYREAGAKGISKTRDREVLSEHLGFIQVTCNGYFWLSDWANMPCGAGVSWEAAMRGEAVACVLASSHWEMGRSVTLLFPTFSLAESLPTPRDASLNLTQMHYEIFLTGRIHTGRAGPGL